MSIDMKLSELLNQVKFDEVFTDILRHVPKVENQRTRFLPAFETLRSVSPAKKAETVIEVHERDYLGEGVHDLWVNTICAPNSKLWENLLAGQIRRNPVFNRSNVGEKITDEQITADILWHLVAYGYPEESPALSGYLLNNRRFPESTKVERIEEICSYIDYHHVTGISHEQIRKYLTAKMFHGLLALRLIRCRKIRQLTILPVSLMTLCGSTTRLRPY